MANIAPKRTARIAPHSEIEIHAHEYLPEERE
jgi:hypothetical protein